MPASANEGNSGTRDINVTVSRTGTAPTDDAAMNVCFTGTATFSTRDDGFSTDADDYRHTHSGTNLAGADSNCLALTMGAVYTATQTLGLRIRGDTEAERDETIVATISFVGTPSSTWSIGTSTATHTIQNDDRMAVRLLPTSDVTFTEETPTDTAAVTVRLARRLYAGENLAVPIEFTGTGLTLQDLGNASYTLSVSGDGATGNSLGSDVVYVRFTGHDTDIVREATVTVTPTSNDDGNTAAGSLTMELPTLSSGDWTNSFTTVGGGGAPHGTDDEVRLVYADNDAPPPCTDCVWITGGSDITEGGNADFVVWANPAPTANLTVPLWVYDARGHSDFLYGKYEGSEKVTILAGQNSAMFTVPTYDDVKDEADGDVRVRISSGRAGGKTFWRRDPYTASVTVRDDDASITTHDPPDVYASVSGSAVTATKTVANNTTGEQVCFGIAGGAYPAVHVNRFKVNYRMRAGTREFWRSYVWLGRDTPFGTQACLELRTLTARCGNPATYTFELLEGGESVTRDRVTRHDVTLDHYDISTSNPTAAFTVTGDACPMRSEQVLPGGTPSEVTVSADRTSVTEGGDVTFTVTANPAPAHDLAVDVTATEEMGAGADQKAVAHLQTLTVFAGTTSATWTLTTMSDEDDLADGTVEFRAFADQNGLYTLGTPSEVTVTLLDDDGVTTQSVPDSVVGDPVTPGVNAALVAEVTAKADGHSNPDAAARLRRIVKGMTGEDGGYTAEECRETATRHGVLSTWKPWCDEIARREAHTPPEPEQQQQQQVITLPAVSVSAGADVTEGGDAVFTVTASPAPAAELSVTVTVATAGEFGVTAGSRTVPIPVTGSATLTLATANDGADEPDGSVSVTVAAGNGYTIGDPASGSVSIADNDAPLPAVTVSAGDAVTEGGDATFTVTASPAPASPLAVSVTVAARGDYGIASGTRTVSIPTAGSATLTLATSDDDADEADGSVSVTVAAGDGYTVGDPASGTVAIADDDLPPPVVSIAATAASVTEGGDAAFTLTADRAPDADLTVTLSVAETGGGDHVAAADEGPATAVIAKGATEAVFSVATVDDDVDEQDGSVTVTLKDGGGYTVSPSPGDAAAVTVSDNDAAALPSLSVADVTVTEGAWMEFTVRLSAPSAGGVSVKVSTRDSTPVSATTRDYWPISGRTVSFRAGETERSVGVIVFDDSHDEEPETFEVVLSDARGAAIADGVAVGTIVNDDPMPAAWLARFGRTVAEQALDGIAGRMTADRTPGMQGSIAGQALSFDPAASDNPGSRGAGPGHAPDGAAVPGGTGALALADVAQAFGGQSGQSGPGGFGHDAAGFGSGFDGMQPQSRGMTARDALLGSSFSLTGATDGSGGSMAFWGRAAQGGFDGREGTFSLDGTVTTGMLGADYARGKWLVGLALAQSAGEGDYRDSDVSPRPDGQTCPDGVDSGLCSGAVRAGDGSVEASLTAAMPYAALQASERLKLWGAAGYGTGEVTLKTALGGSYKADTTWSMAAAGLRGDLLAPPAEGSGPALAVTSDALWTRSSSEKTRDLAASDSDATRLRLGLEGSYRMALEGGGHLTPKLEVGARHDGGDAETGFGVEIGGGIAWSDPALGLSLDVSGRTLIAHGNDDLKDRGYAASLAFDPAPATKRGPSLSLRQEFGGQAQGGLDALFQPATLEDRTGSEAASRWAMEAAWGFPAFGGRWTGSPHVGLGFATAARDYSIGWRLTPEGRTAANVSFGLRATRRENAAQAPEHTIGFEITARW